MPAAGRLLLAARLREGRQRADLSQVELARRLGVPQPIVSRLETGLRRVELVEFLVLCRTLDLDPHGLLREVEEATSASQIF